MRILLVHNPVAGNGRRTTTTLARTFERAGHQVTDVTLDSDLWERCLDTPADAIVASGGDGTARTVAVALARRPELRLPLALLPEGTANNIARTLNMPARAAALAAVLDSSDIGQLAVGSARGPWGERHFLESAGVGIFATMLRKERKKTRRRRNGTRDVDEELARGVAKLKKLLEKAEPMDVDIEADGGDLSGRYIMAQAMNIVSAGSRVELAPDADPADRELDLVLVSKDEREPLIEYLDRLAADDEDAVSPLIAHRCHHIQMSWPRGAGHVDDKEWPKDDKWQKGAEVEIRAATTIPVLQPRPRKAPAA